MQRHDFVFFLIPFPQLMFIMLGILSRVLETIGLEAISSPRNYF